ncbi:MAG: threonine synthase [Pseudomonadota bacterium]
MHYVSTRGQAPHLSFEDVLLTGLAGDGGLFVPDAVPTLPAKEIRAMQDARYEDVAFTVMQPFVGECFPAATLRDLITAAYQDFGHIARAPLMEIDRGHFLCELFHGPTLAFKDFAMQLIGQMMAHVLDRRRARVTIVGATSGDTGSAAIEAFAGLDAVDVVILYPHGRVSDVQRRQMTTPKASNIRTLAVHGTFDDCQRHLKDMFADLEFRDGVRLAAVNSINWARVMAQIVYYFTAATSLGAPDRPVSFTVPTGNFGDIYAGEMARRMGLPIADLVVATNQNDILDRAINAGQYQVGDVRPSISPSMDIQVSSNFERLLFDAYGRDGNAIAQLMTELAQNGGFSISQGVREHIAAGFSAGSATEAQTAARIRATLHQSAELVCPHTAVGLDVATRHQRVGIPMITLATAHPAKFPIAVEEATGVHPALPKRMADLYDRSERVTEIANDLETIKSHIRDEVLA